MIYFLNDVQAWESVGRDARKPVSIDLTGEDKRYTVLIYSMIGSMESIGYQVASYGLDQTAQTDKSLLWSHSNITTGLFNCTYTSLFSFSIVFSVTSMLLPRQIAQ